LIKECAPDVPLILGGPHCMISPQQALQDHHAQVSMLGEGEYRIGPLMNALQGKQPLSSIPGIVYREGDRFHATAPDSQLFDLDALPFPSRGLVDKYTYGYSMGIKLLPGKVTSMMSSRGCPFNCVFCQEKFFLPHYRTHSAERIIAEIDELVRTGYNSIVFVDDNFLVQKNKIETVMDHIIKEGYELTLWIVNARVDSADRSLYAKLRKAGVEFITYGVESGDQEILDFYQKKITVDQIKNAIVLSNEAGFFTSANFIFGAPIEERKHIRNTIDLVKSLPFDNVIFRNLGYMAKSPLWEEAVREGKIKPEECIVPSDRDRGLANFTQHELEVFCDKAYFEFLLSSRYLMREMRFALAHHNSRFLRLGFRMFLSRLFHGDAPDQTL
jgi:anaerobic magnesium-protoporphyrin IX monomethyl ester cyclase